MKKLWDKDSSSKPKTTTASKIDAFIEQFETKDDLLLDQKLLKFDVYGSLAHAKGLRKINILSEKELRTIQKGLLEILKKEKKGERKKVIKLLKEAGMDVVVCPSEALNMLQLHEKTSPMHNSIAPVVELMEAGVNVALGTDNIFDIYGPFNDGDMFRECHVLMDAIRWWHMDEVVKIATVNGRRALGIKK